MPERRNNFFTDLLNAVQQNAIAVAVVITVLMMFIPVPKGLIDVSMVLNLAVSLTVLLTVIYTKRAAEFTSFPRLILLVTLFGLAINITSTRLILTNPVTGSGARVNMSGQSEMVQAFANIATGNSVIVGFIIFIILIVVQVVVVTKGATRVSEVTARFTLDSMNNKMFDVQNELNSGAITEEQAAQKKARIRQEVDFYSAMDGASKFVSGNVKAGIFITALNLIAGMITGMMMGGMDFTSALNSYAKLTIGDGLMSQLPSLMLSFATGILVTGGSTDEVVAEQLKKNFSVSPVVYIIVGVALIAMGLAFHNGSSVVLVPVGALFVYFGIRMSGLEKKQELKRQAEAASAPAKARQPGSAADEVAAVATLPPLSLDLGYTLVPLVDREKGAELLERVTRIRREEALDLGLVVPPIRIRDSMSVDPDEYTFKIRGIEVGRAKLKLGYYMCLNTGNVPKGRELAGERTKDPAFGMEAVWIPEEKRVEAEKAGYAVIDPPTIIATHLTEIIKRHAAEILTRQEVSALVNKIKETNPVVVDEVLSGEHKFSYGEIEAVLKNLLEEQVSIRNMVTILETLANFAPLTKDPVLLTEKVRQALGAQICLQYADDEKILHVLRLSQSLSEKMLEHKAEQPGQKPFVAFDPVDGRKYIEQMSASIAAVRDRNYLPIVLCADEVRQLVKSSTERELPGLVVISIGEVMTAGPEIKIETLGDIDVQ